jgi:hypothetical protein
MPSPSFSSRLITCLPDPSYFPSKSVWSVVKSLPSFASADTRTSVLQPPTHRLPIRLLALPSRAAVRNFSFLTP